MRAFLVSISTVRRERKRWLEWLKEEHATYSDPKFDSARDDHDTHMRGEGVGLDGWWANQVFQYVARANALGLGNPLGRQALIKGLAAYTGMVESMIRVYGDPPKAGVPSGELV